MQLRDLRSLLVEMPIGQAYEGQWYYHGTSGDNGRQILQDGVIKIPDHGKKRAALTPMKGKVYLTMHFPEALTNAIGANVHGMILSRMKGHKLYGSSDTKAIVRVSKHALNDSYDVDEDHLAEFFFRWYYITPRNTEERTLHRLAQDIVQQYVEGDEVQMKRLNQLQHDPAFHVAVQLAKAVLKKMAKNPQEHARYRKRLEKSAFNMAYKGEAPIDSVLFFQPSDFDEIPNEKLDSQTIYTWDLMAKYMGKVESPTAAPE